MVMSNSMTAGRHARAGRSALGTLLGTYTVSAVAESMTLVAIPWFVLETTGSVTRTGLLVAVAAISSALVGLLVGPLIDRVGHRRASVVTYALGGLAVGAVPLADSRGLLSFPVLLLLVVLGSVLDTPGTVALRGRVRQMARASRVELEPVNGVMQTAANSAGLFGPALGAGVIAIGSATWVLVIDALACLLMAVVVGTAGPAARPERAPPGGPVGPQSADEEVRPAGAAGLRRYSGELRDGLAVIGRTRLLRTLVKVATGYSVLDGAFVGVLLIVFAYERIGDPASLGVLVSAFGAGALCGSVLYGALGGRLPRRPVYLIAGLVVAAGVGGLALAGGGGAERLAVSAVLLGLVGCAAAPVDLMTTVAVQRAAPEGAYGRVAGTLATCAGIGAPVGIAVGTLIVGTAGLVAGMVALASGYLLVTLLAWRSSSLHDLDLDPVPALHGSATIQPRRPDPTPVGNRTNDRHSP